MKTSMQGSSFKFPEFYNFPPFFTLQPVLDTRNKQLSLWRDLILSYCEHNRIYTFALEETPNCPLFHNDSINRSLKTDETRQVFEFLCSEGRAEWLNNQKSRILVFWRTPAEWADSIYAWAESNGLLNSVCTLYELQQAEDQEWYQIDMDMLNRALRHLQSLKKCKIFTGNNPQATGVKFL